MGDLAIGEFFGLSLSVGAVVTGITQIVKITENIPWLGKFPPVRWLLDTIVEGKNANAKRVFVAALCFGLSLLAIKLKTGVWPDMDVRYLLFSIKAFFDATASYHFVLDRGAGK